MQSPGRPLSIVDLDHVFTPLAPDWERLHGARVFLTGGTGFVGTWLVETLLDANRRLSLGIQLVLLTRNPRRWATQLPHLATASGVTAVEGDVRSLSSISHPALAGCFDYIIHAAFDSGQVPCTQSPWMVLDTLLTGARQVLDFAERCGAKRLMYISSGAVYGPQPPTVSHLSEDFLGGPNPVLPQSAYAEGKRAAELLTVTHAQQFGYESVIARGFAFVGPHLPLGAHFAAGNFLRDILEGRDITIQGDGTPLRSYLYAADMALWLWTILFRGGPGRAYNVGSPVAISIADLARRLANLALPPASVHVLKTPTAGKMPEQYVPDVTRARDELGLNVTISLDEAFRRTFAYHRGA